jgi:hypothetical protein
MKRRPPQFTHHVWREIEDRPEALVYAVCGATIPLQESTTDPSCPECQLILESAEPWPQTSAPAERSNVILRKSFRANSPKM